MLAWILDQAGLAPGFLVGGVPLNFGVSARLGDPGGAVRDRGRRVRHRLLRQAQQVRPLPAAHGDPQQPRVRPRRHLRRPRRHRAPVPPPRAHRAGPRPDRRQRARGGAAARPGDGLLERGAALRRQEGSARHAARARRAARLRRAARRPEDRARRVGAARRAQPAQRAGRDRPPPSTSASRPRSRRARWPAFATSGAASSCAASPAASRSTTTSPTTRPRCARPSTACAARSARRASSPSSSRARTP